MAAEANPIVAAAIGKISWSILAAGKLLVVVAAFAVFRYVDGLEIDGVDSSRIALGGGLATTALLFANAANDLLVFTETYPDTVLVGRVFSYTAFVLLISAVAFVRPNPTFRLPSPKQRKNALSVSLALVVVLSILSTGVYAFGGVQQKNTKLEATTTTLQNEWENTSAGASGMVTVDGENHVIFANNADGITAYDSQGNQIWSFSGSSGSSFYAIDTAPNGDIIAYDDDNDEVHRLYPNGTVKWTNSGINTGSTYGANDIAVAPDGEIYIATSDYEWWSVSSDGSSASVMGSDYIDALAVDDQGHLYISDDTSAKITRINRSDGSAVWEYTNSSIGRVEQLSAGPNGDLWFGANAENGLHVVTNTGVYSARYANVGTTSNSIHSGPEYVYSADGNNELHLVYPSNGTVGDTVAGGYGGSASGISTDGNGHVFYGTTQVLRKESGAGSVKSPTKTVSGVVRDQNGDPVSNATVKVVGVDYSQISASQSESLRDRANELLDEAQDPLPSSWDSSLDLTGDTGAFASQDANYVAVNTPENMESTAWVDETDLSNPRIQMDAGEDVILSVWNPTQSSRLLGQHEYDSQLPGRHQKDATVVVKQLAPDGDVVQTTKLKTSKTLGGGLGDPDSFAYARASLSRGVYRVSAKDSEFSYTIVVGSPSALSAEISQDLRNEADSLTDHAKDIKDKFTDGKFTKTTVETDENGQFNASLGSNVKTVSVTAYKLPRGMNENATRADVREWYNAMLFSPTSGSDVTNTIGGLQVDYEDGFSRSDANLSDSANLSTVVPSFYLPADAKTVSVPKDDVTVRVLETTKPEFADANVSTNRTEWLEDLLANRTQRLDELFSQLNASRERYEELFTNYTAMLEQNEAFRDRVLNKLEARTGNRTFNVTTNASTEKLRDRIWALQETMSELRGSIDGETDTEVGEDTVSSIARFPGQLSRDSIAVLVRYSNGTTRTVPEQYVNVEQSAGTAVGVGDTTIQVEEMPLGDAGSAEIEYQVVSSEGIGREKAQVDNPAVPGQPPSVPGVKVSTMSPEPGERVTVDLKPSADSTYENLTAFSARYVTNGTAVDNAERTGSRSGAVTANCACKIQVSATFTDGEGTEYQRTFVLRSTKQGNAQAPSIRAQSGPTGVWALVSDGINNGQVAEKNGELVFTAQIGESEDPPNTIHAYAADFDTDPNQEITVNVVRGEDQSSVQTRSTVVVHMRALGDNANVYRGEQPTLFSPFAGDPIQSGSNAGSISEQDDRTTINTYTDASGSVTVGVNNDPSTTDQIAWTIATNVPEPSLPFGMLGVPVVFFGFIVRRNGGDQS
jgi:hypothetical protein